MKIIGVIVLIIAAFIGGNYIGVRDTVAAMVAPSRSTGITQAIWGLFGAPPLPSAPAASAPHEAPSAPSRLAARNDPERQLSIEVQSARIDRYDRMKAAISVTNDGDAYFSIVAYECLCDDENGRFSDGGGNLSRIEPHSTTEGEASCFEKVRGKKPTISCRISTALE